MESVVLPYALYIFMGLIFFLFCADVRKLYKIQRSGDFIFLFQYTAFYCF